MLVLFQLLEWCNASNNVAGSPQLPLQRLRPAFNGGRERMGETVVAEPGRHSMVGSFCLGREERVYIRSLRCCLLSTLIDLYCPSISQREACFRDDIRSLQFAPTGGSPSSRCSYRRPVDFAIVLRIHQTRFGRKGDATMQNHTDKIGNTEQIVPFNFTVALYRCWRSMQCLAPASSDLPIVV